jgi:PAS domain S-box-containing protein
MNHLFSKTKKAPSLADRIERFITILLITFVIFLGGGSLLVLRNELALAYRQRLDQEWIYQASRISALIQTIHGELKKTAQSSLISTALVDSAGKDAYLIPYLQGLRRVEGIPISLIFADFEGKEIATNGEAAITDEQMNWLRGLLKDPSIIPVTIMGDGDSAVLLVTEMIYYSRTTTPEGALMYRVKIKNLADSYAQLHWNGSGFIPEDGMIWHPLKLHPDLESLGLSLALSASSVAPSRLGSIFYIYLFIAFIGIGLAIWVSRRISRNLTKDLQLLSDFAGNVVSTGLGKYRANLGETREITRLAGAINGMLDRLDEQHQKLQKEGEEKFRNLVENIPGAAYRWNLLGQGSMDYISRGIEELTGYMSSDFLNNKSLSYSDLIYPEDRQIREIIDHEPIHIWEYRIQHLNGDIRWIWERNRTIYDEACKAIYLEGVLFDVTERKDAEDALINAIRITESANLAKSQFLATMSHELRTPMNGIVGMAELLAQPDLKNDIRMMYAKIVFESSQTLLSLLNDILDLSRIEAGKLSINESPLYLRSLINDVELFFNAAVKNKNLTIHSMCESSCRQVYLGDSLRLRQMLSNLVGNAVKFTHEGVITINVSEISCDDNYASIEFSVTDTGIGIPQEKISSLFHPFSQVDSSDTRKFGGSGLGLSITHNLAELMGGSMGVESEDGKGSRFWFRIQLKLTEENKII